MSVILDIIGSVLIAAVVILLGLRLNQSIVENNTASTASLNLQESLVDAASNIEYDFRKAGYGVAQPEDAVALADSTRIRFRADIIDAGGNPVPDGIVDSVEWYLGPPVHMASNDTLRSLYRRVNQLPPSEAATGVAFFKLRYFDKDGTEIRYGGPTTRILQFETTMRLQSPYKVQLEMNVDAASADLEYTNCYWRQTRLASRNISRR